MRVFGEFLAGGLDCRVVQDEAPGHWRIAAAFLFGFIPLCLELAPASVFLLLQPLEWRHDTADNRRLFGRRRADQGQP